jgi:hypothetical protein
MSGLNEKGPVMKNCMVVLIAGISLCAFFCQSDRYVPRAAQDGWVMNHPVLHAEIHYLPDGGKTFASVVGDSLFIERKSTNDSLLSSVRYQLAKNEYTGLDSLLFFFDHVAPAAYAKPGVIDGTKMWFTYGGRQISCDNCLHDYVLAASGLKLAKPSGKMANLKNGVAALTGLVDRAEAKTKKRWTRVEVIANSKGLTDTTQKYQVKKYQQK